MAQDNFFCICMVCVRAQECVQVHVCLTRGADVCLRALSFLLVVLQLVF